MVSAVFKVALYALAITGEVELLFRCEVSSNQPPEGADEGADTNEEADRPGHHCSNENLIILVWIEWIYSAICDGLQTVPKKVVGNRSKECADDYSGSHVEFGNQTLLRVWNRTSVFFCY